MSVAYSVTFADDGTPIFDPDTPEARADFVKTFDDYPEMKCFFYEAPRPAQTEG